MLTVITPAPTYDLTVLATVKERLGITDGTQDTILGHLISAASDKAATYCNRVFAQETVQETIRLHRKGGRFWHPESIKLKRFPIASFVSIVDGTTTLVSSVDYEFDAIRGLLYRLDGSDNRCHWLGPKIVIQYVGGYAVMDSLPYPIEEAVIEIIKLTWYGKQRDPMLRSEGEPGIGQQQFWVGSSPGQIGPLPPAISGILDQFRDVQV